MTKKDYIALAKTVKDQWDMVSNDAQDRANIKIMAMRIAVVCKQDNPRFDADRFLTACGVQ